MAVLAKLAQEKVAELLVSEGLADAELVRGAHAKADAEKKPLLDVLLDEHIANEEMIAHATAVVIGVPYVNLNGVRLDQDTLLLLPQDVLMRVMAVPLGIKDGVLVVATLDVTDVQAIDYLASMAGKPVRAVMASERGIKEILAQYRGDFESVDEAVRATDEENAIKLSKSRVKTIVQDSPISKALTNILNHAALSNASDIHIEPLEDSLIIRYRIDGVLRRVMELPKSVAPALVSRIKILSDLKIDEHRVPQDGEFTVLVNDKEIDLRIATAPVTWGEQVVIRLLDKSSSAMMADKMGLVGRASRAVREGIKKPNGMILTSGPTGSGKSTTLYALLQEIKSDAINIVTLEDPVEYKMEGVNQIQINVDAGLTFASGLRSILRQDPDVVMVGEIRDAETASLAVQAALTGHLVFSTLHTNSAAGILPRLLDMGVEPFLLASTLNTVIGQRLVRRVTDKHEVYRSSQLETAEINTVLGDLLPTNSGSVITVSNDLGYAGLPVKNNNGYTLVRGISTKETPGGYHGRTGIFEAITVDEEIQQLLIARATAQEIMRAAKKKGTVTLRQDGMLKALSGITTIEEVNRVASDLV